MMSTTTNGRRAVAALMLAALVTTMVAPAAEAGHRRYKHGRSKSRVVVVQQAPTRVVVRESSVVPVIAFLGGLVIGASVAHASHPAEYAYYDPYCDARYTSLEVYHTHFRHHRHPRTVRVIHVASNRCVDTYRYHDGHWYGRDRWDSRWDGDGRWDDGDAYSYNGYGDPR